MSKIASLDDNLMRKALEVPTSTEGLEAMVQFHSGVFDDVVSTQLEGWGASNFLVHGNRAHFTVVAEFRGGSGNMFDRQYAANTLRTWHVLAAEVVRLREIKHVADTLAGALREQVAYLCNCSDGYRCRPHEALEAYHKYQKELDSREAD